MIWKSWCDRIPGTIHVADRREDRVMDALFFGVKSKAIPVGLGLLLVIFAVVPLLTPGIPAPPLPVVAIRIVCGVVFVWMGLSR